MRHRLPRLGLAALHAFVLLAVVAGFVAGCTGTLQRATGIVVNVQSQSLTEIDAFELRTAEGQILTFAVGPITFDGGSFPPQHLREHQALAQPVLVTYRVEDGRNVAIKLEDAPDLVPQN
ncbi:MAG: hypothetical protein QOH61_1522 [Chloroflexota bacterium]|nr:hypothetical protein [Chloroflexota bacterium]